MKNPETRSSRDEDELIASEMLRGYENYVGACDVYSPEDARAMAKELRENRRSPDRKVMIGVMTHPLALHPEIEGPGLDEVRKVFPTREELAGGFTDDPDVLNTIHYADLYGPRAGKNLSANLELTVEYGGENLHAIQLDVTWPDADELKGFMKKHPQIRMILQIGTFALEKAGNDPQTVINRLREYGDSIDHVLFDKSMGKGKSMNSEELLPMLRLMKKELPDIGLAVAGGLGSDSLHLIESIAEEFPDMSIDAQGRLKPTDTPKDVKGHMHSTVPADLEISTKYIKDACKMLDNPKK